jgi:16S rRNA (cytidine1402-2'-O)-methyltransferase
VATPIGNLKDITPRAVSALQEADVIFAEDTRTAMALLNYLGIKKPVKSYHKVNEVKASKQALACLENGERIALISEAGLPGISDPGYLLTRRLMEKSIPFEVVPGVSAVTHAVAASALSKNGSFLFYGFLPRNGTKKALETLKKTVFYPIVFFESPYRVIKTLEFMLDIFQTPIAVCRELTKLHEEVLWIHAKDELKKLTVKGEFCLVADNTVNCRSTAIDIDPAISMLRSRGFSSKDIAVLLKSIGISFKFKYNNNN